MSILEDLEAATVTEKERLSAFGSVHRSWKDRMADHKGALEFVIDGYNSSVRFSTIVSLLCCSKCDQRSGIKP